MDKREGFVWIENWGIGVLGYWGIGVLGYWGIGVLGYWGIYQLLAVFNVSVFK